MTYETSSSGRAQPGARPSQHISSIAHLFFDNSSDTEDAPRKSVDRNFLVVGSGRDTRAPYTAVGLGQHLLDPSATVGQRGNTDSAVPIRQVFFAEPSPVCFSGVSHLQEGSFRPPTSEEVVPWPLRQGATAAVLRLFPGQVPSEDVSGGMVEGRFFIRHLDLPREMELSALETQAAAGHATGVGEGCVNSLIWCVQSSAAVNLALVGRLGRLLRVSKPMNVYLLVYPDRAKASSKGATEVTEALMHRSSRLVQYVADGIPVQPLLMGDSPQEQSIQLASLSRQLCL